MGGCLGAPRGEGGGAQDGGGHGGGDGHSMLSDSTSSPVGGVIGTKNRPLRHERIRWKSDIPLTEGQLKSKRDEFWDTAPAFEGKAEIWMALKAAVEATEKEEDYTLAQAILDGAGVSLPHGSLVECYDELGTRYAIPVYCLSQPINLLVDDNDESDSDSPADFSEPVTEDPQTDGGREMKVRVRLSLTGTDDVKMVVRANDSVARAKHRLFREGGAVPEPARQRWFYGGKLLRDKAKFSELGIPSGHVIQCVVHQLDFDVIQTK